jgi:toxin ParE1/3/4
MLKIRLTSQARSDLDGIGVYTRDEWGMDQAMRYLTALDQCFQHLAKTSDAGRPRPDIRPGLFSERCNRHVVFFRRTSNSLEILRILHDRMDVSRHL